ncbi:MAG: holliday junction helicase RuvA, partial [Solirubrobacteraceae bacterium]|nr:holliday junction helicase RuvA [Solirubrobacteraceae bacterium]
MIALVAGEVAVRRPDHVVIETSGGVGYRLAVSVETLRHVPAVGRPVSLHSHLVVRDDALALYGFATEEERDLFLLLLGVQSVGPKVALAVLGGGPPRDLVAALAAGDLSTVRDLARRGRGAEGGPAGRLEMLDAFLDRLDGDGAMRVEYLRAAEGMAGRVVLTGRLEHDDLADLLPACEALVTPSTFPEAFGMVA